MKYVHVKNLEKYHPKFKDRKLVWCKLYFSTLNYDPEFMVLDEIDKWRYFAFVMLELQLQNHVPIDHKFLTMKGFDLKKRPIDLTLRMLHTLIETCNNSISSRYQDDPLDKEEDKEEDKDTKKKFVVPSLEEVKQYFSEKGYTEQSATKFYDYYSIANWTDSKGNRVKNWKQKAQGVWFKDENKIKVQQDFFHSIKTIGG